MSLKSKLTFIAVFFSLSSNAAVNPLTLKQWSNEEKYVSKTVKTIPFLGRDYFIFAGLNIGFKNGAGVDMQACKKLNRYLCGGARLFVGSLNAQALVRTPTAAETTAGTVPKTSEYDQILSTPESWFSFIPELGFSVNTQIIPLDEGYWSESSWFGIGKAMIGGRQGWSFSFEQGINRTFESVGKLGWSIRAKYTFGWLYPKDAVVSPTGSIPFDLFNLTAGIFYVW